MHLSKNQKRVVDFLYKNPRFRLTSSEMTHFLNALMREENPTWWNNQDEFHRYWTAGTVHSCLSRLEKRGIVRRNKGIPGKWQLTADARIAYGNDLSDRSTD